MSCSHHPEENILHAFRMSVASRLLLGSLLLAEMLVLTLPVLAAQLVVNTAVDENDGSCSDGDCALRDAIAVAASGTLTQTTVRIADKYLKSEGSK
ncbi:hypothetical protein TFLX_05604 [Thermoflexales bacterium]|nr:hypothetical protein TFLX_05604 [Thermoflexales bacterium]